ncbi:MAG: acyl-CoA dehydrogenase family protein [Planctomycetota bacterium]|nr:acyl-CoA dehydrogenase family protein [Planctomycetota bacterium]
MKRLEALRELGLRVGKLGEPVLAGLDETAAARKALALVSESGATAWTVPERWGGAASDGLCAPDEVSCRAMCALRAPLAYHSAMLDVMLVMQGLGSYSLARAGQPAVCERVLPRVAAGELVAGFGLTEPEAGSDLGMVSTRAEKHGTRWRIRGAKTFISNAGIADVYTLLARTSGEPGDGGKGSLTMFLVRGDAKGLSTRRFEVTSPHPIGDVVLEDVEVPDEERIGAVGGGLEVALGTLGRFRTSVAAAANGFARRALDESLARTSTRQQFGKPLSAFQGLAFDLAEMDTRLRAAELLVEEAANAVDRGERALEEVARAKLFATENASWVCDRAVQHFGGLGVVRGSVVEQLWRDVRALRIYEGTSEIQKLILSRALVARAAGK